MSTTEPNVVCTFNEAEYRLIRKLVDNAILATPTSETRDRLTDINIKLMRDAEASDILI